MGSIKNIPNMERPYEKMLMYGESVLSNSELLSIIIKTGTKQKSSIEIAQEIINKNSNETNSLRFLQTISIQELKKICGVGIVKAIELKAVGEIAKRISRPLITNKNVVNCGQDIVSLFMEEMQNEKNEILKIVMLDNKNIIKKIQNLAIGSENNIQINIKLILSEPLKMQIPKIILVHNHPSGDPNPSEADKIFTQKLYKAAQLLDIELLDHIVIGDGTYQSIIGL